MKLRNEYPRPSYIRKNALLNLNGEWGFEFDDNNLGHKEKWFNKNKGDKLIIVPFCYESKLSGIEDRTRHDRCWYYKEVELKINKDKLYILNFNGVDYYSEIYVNGIMVKIHTGGASIFKVDITDFINDGKNVIAVYAYDPMKDQDIPRGKQYWKEQSESIFYTKTSGIYKTVYIEELDKTYIDETYITSDIDKGTINIKLIYNNKPHKVGYEIYKDEKLINEQILLNNFESNIVETTLRVWNNGDINEDSFHHQDLCWSPEHPYLYDLILKTYDENGNVIDEVKTYFAMRKVHYDKGVFYLNGRPYYQKLVLIQGYWKDGILSHKSIDDLEFDIKISKKLGFNGGRIHQKVEDPYFYYLCDKLGFIAWLEYPAAQLFTNRLMQDQMNEWIDVVKAHYNHPSIVTYVPLNESWGIPHCSTDVKEQQFQNAMYSITKAIDSTRLCVGNDGWELTLSDTCSVHNYLHGEPGNTKVYNEFKLALSDQEHMIKSASAGRPIFVTGYTNYDVPILLTEFGGVGYSISETKGWGYTSVKNKDEYISELKRIYEAIKESKCIVGYCYTQLYDVEQEINGILTYDRKLKVEAEKVKEINDSISNRLQIAD